MRVIAGEWRGRRLAAPRGDITRPTADRVRETLFNMLVSRLGTFEQLRVADLFAGSGALGLEALSRGAAHCLFVEQDRGALAVLRQNLAALNAGERATVRAGSVLDLGPAREGLDLLLLDPPYGSGAGQVALHRLLRLRWIGPATLAVLETAADDTVQIPGFRTDGQRIVGKARLTFLLPEKE
ncbi:16S rRNA (guanine(966)-N(2))-methyltransferase RsmD [Porphyrobacter sp. GA68]|uniref:16S rRNA (guanine(966)-N(2))-methyltransferase RsmD n=1 Tax=Porphyrobacter sp. GA68 TaxID=2883480 RepID=UPI001D17DC05|nr:16S rRNA (guanine(966)-N(2))-methyltransferase RsmD [Porphyrobacter sp. GA68]